MNHDSTTVYAGFSDLIPTPVALVVAPAIATQSRNVVPPTPNAVPSPRQNIELELSAILHSASERVRYITGATGVALALCESEADEMICRAGSGPTAPEVGTRMNIQSGITAESIRTRQTLRCDEASTDPRVNQETCKALGIESVMVMPLIVGASVVGILELFGHQPSAFGERDAKTLHGAADGVQVALDRAVSAGFTLGRIPWAIEIEKPLGPSIQETTGMSEAREVLEANAERASDGITLRTPVVFSVADFPETDDRDDAPEQPIHNQPHAVPAFLARLADEAKPTAGKRWSHWFRPQW